MDLRCTGGNTCAVLSSDSLLTEIAREIAGGFTEMIWNETKECMSRDELEYLQGKRLVKVVDRVYHNVKFYRKKMQE